MEEIKSVLFVCTGNSCRSVMAEGLLKKYLAAGKRAEIEVSSCGTAAMPGFPPTVNTLEVMKKEGIDASGYKTSRLTGDLINKSDLILTMERVHTEEVIRLVPGAKNRTYLLREFVKEETDSGDLFVPDPIGRPLAVYERIIRMIKEAVERLIKKI